MKITLIDSPVANELIQFLKQFFRNQGAAANRQCMFDDERDSN